MDVGQFFSRVAGAYFFITAVVLAVTAMRARADDDENIGARLFRAANGSALFIGLPTLLGVLWFLSSERQGHGNSGMMSANTTMVVLFLIGAFALVLTWACSAALAFMSAAIVKNARPIPALLITFFFVQFAPGLAGLLFIAQAPN